MWLIVAFHKVYGQQKADNETPHAKPSKDINANYQIVISNGFSKHNYGIYGYKITVHNRVLRYGTLANSCNKYWGLLCQPIHSTETSIEIMISDGLYNHNYDIYK